MIDRYTYPGKGVEDFPFAKLRQIFGKGGLSEYLRLYRLYREQVVHVLFEDGEGRDAAVIQIVSLR